MLGYGVSWHVGGVVVAVVGCVVDCVAGCYVVVVGADGAGIATVGEVHRSSMIGAGSDCGNLVDCENYGVEGYGWNVVEDYGGY